MCCLIHILTVCCTYDIVRGLWNITSYIYMACDHNITSYVWLVTFTACCCRSDGRRPEIYLKREDLNHTGAHKINNSLGQALLCLRMGKKRIIAETGAGQHGVATVRGRFLF